MVPTYFYIFYILTLIIFPTIIGFKKADKTQIKHPFINILKLMLSILIFNLCIEYVLDINNSNPEKILSASYFIPLSAVFTASLGKITKHTKISINYYQGTSRIRIVILILLMLIEILSVHLIYGHLKPLIF